MPAHATSPRASPFPSLPRPVTSTREPTRRRYAWERPFWLAVLVVTLLSIPTVLLLGYRNIQQRLDAALEYSALLGEQLGREKTRADAAEERLARSEAATEAAISREQQLVGALGTRDAELQSVEQALVDTRQALDQEREQRVQAESTNLQDKNELARERSSNSALQRQNEELKRQTQSSQHRDDGLKRQVADLRHRNDVLQKKLTETEGAAREAEERYTNSRRRATRPPGMWVAVPPGPPVCRVCPGH